MRARYIGQIAGLGLVLGLVTAPTNARTLIDMPALKGALVTFLAENPPARPGAVALNRYSYRRVTPLYSYRSPPVWPSYCSGWRVGYPYGYGYGWGYGYGYGYGWGRGWGWRSGWPWGYPGHYVIGSRTFRGLRYRSGRSSW